MASSGNKAASESDVTSPDAEPVVCFDDETLKAAAEVYNDEGNKAYSQKDYSNAVFFYTEGIKVNCKDDNLKAELYSNRAAAHLSLGKYSDSLRDAKDATDIRPLLFKAILTGANAFVKLNLFEQAITWCNTGLTIDKENTTLLELRKLAADKASSNSGVGGTDHKTCQLSDGTHGLHDAKEGGQDRDTEGKESELLGASCHLLDNYKKEIDFPQQTLIIEAKSGNNDSLRDLGNAFASLDGLKNKIEFSQQANSIEIEIGNDDSEGKTFANLGNVSASLGDFKTAIGFYQLALSIAKEIGDKDSEGGAYINLGSAYYSLGDFKKAIEFHQQGLSIAKDIGNKDLEKSAYINLGSAYYFLGDFKKAIEFHQQGLSIAKAIGNKSSEGNAYCYLGNAYHSLGRFENAIEFYQQGLSIAKEIENKGLEGKAYMDLGTTHLSLGDFKKAIEFHQQGRSIAKEIGDKTLEGNVYMNLGTTYHSLGDFKKATEFYQQGLSIAKETENKGLEGNGYGNLGNAYQSLGDFKKAIEFHQQGLSIAKEIGNKDSEGNGYGNLGNAYYSLGDLKRAIEFYQQALSIAKEIGNINSEGNACMSLGNAYSSLGDLKTAIEFHQQSLKIAKEIGNKGSEGSVYGNLGNAYDSLGDFKKAIEFHQQSLSIAKEIGNKDSQGNAYINLGIAYHSLGDFKKAIEFHQQALSIAKEIGNKASEGKAYLGLANAYHCLCDLEQAIEFYQQCLSIGKEIGNKEAEGKAYSNLGTAYHSLGDFTKAIEFHQQGLTIAKEIGNKDLVGYAYDGLGSEYFSLRDFKKAIEFHQQALSIAKEIGSKSLEEIAYSRLGFAYNALGDYPKAEKLLQSSTKVLEETRFLLQQKDEWKIGFRDQRKVYDHLCAVQLSQGKTDDALLTAERGRAQALVDLMKSKYGIEKTLEEQIERIPNIASHVSSTTVFLAQDSNYVMLWVLPSKGHEWQFLELKHNSTLGGLTDKAYTQIVVDKRVRCEDRSLDDPEDEKLEELFDRGTDEKESTRSREEGDPLNVLYEVVIAPISHFIEGDELIIVPDGSSFLIPYAALVDQSSRYLSETLRIRLAPSLKSLRLLEECPDGRHSTSGALLVGDPWIETVRLKREDKIRKFAQLPGAEKEVKMIGRILNVEPLTGKNATKDQVLSRLSSVSLVHIAAHGCAETGEIIMSPNRPSSKRPKEKEFLLTMEDVLNAELHAKLVVLSCCHSGRGKIKAEGVVGVARAFLGAGARSVIASLWAINDEATLEFMRQFYEHLVKGQSASKSLHQAMKWMRESDDFRALRYWAPFMLIGDDVTLTFNQ